MREKEDETQVKVVSLNQEVLVDVIKSSYVVEGLSPRQVSDKLNLPMVTVSGIIKKEQFGKLRRAHVRHGLHQLQNLQINQANEIIELETQFKDIRIVQLRASLENLQAYFSLHGDFYRRDPESMEILTDRNGIPIQIKLPNAAKEMREIKEAVVMSEGIKRILTQIEQVLRGEDTTEGMLTMEDLFSNEAEEQE